MMTIDVILKVLHISNFSSANTTLELSMDDDIRYHTRGMSAALILLFINKFYTSYPWMMTIDIIPKVQHVPNFSSTHLWMMKKDTIALVLLS